MPIIAPKFDGAGLGRAIHKSSSGVKKIIFNLVVLALLISIGFVFLFLSNPMNPILDPSVILAIFLGLVVAFLLISRVESSALLLILFMPLSDVFVVKALGINVRVSDQIALGAIAIFMIRLAFDRSLFRIPDPLRRPMLGFVIFGIIGSLLLWDKIPHNFKYEDASGLNSPELRTWTQNFWAVYSFLIYYMISRIVRTRKILNWCISAMMITAVLVGLFAISGQRYWTGEGFRVIGTFSEPSYYAEWLALVIPIAIALTMCGRQSLSRWGLFATITLLLVNLFLTFSTGGYAAGVASIVVVFFLSARTGLLQSARPAKITLAIVLITGACGVAVGLTNADTNIKLQAVFNKILRPETSSHSAMVRERARYAAEMTFIDYPLWGVGPGNYPFHRLKYIKDDRQALDYEKQLRWDPQNLYLEVLSERGVIGMFFFLWLWFAYFAALFKGIKESQDSYSKALLIGFVASAVGVLVGYWGHANFFRLYIWVVFGLGIATARLAREPAGAKTLASPGVEDTDERSTPRNIWPNTAPVRPRFGAYPTANRGSVGGPG